MKITGILEDIGLQAFHVPQCSGLSEMPRVWTIVAGKSEIEIWHRKKDGFGVIAHIVPEHKDESLGIFIAEFTNWLLFVRDQDILDRIVLVAPDDTLKFLRDSMPTDLIACIAAEIHRDLGGLRQGEKREALDKLISV